MSLLEGCKRLRSEIKDESLQVELENLWHTAMEKVQEFQKGTSGQGIYHCRRVESNIWSLIHKDVQEFRPIDLFLLSASAALHDIGKIDGNQKNKDHGLISRERLLKGGNWKEFFRDKLKAQAVGHIISVHSNGEIDSLPEEFIIGNPPGVLLRSLASIFRLADMLDTDFRRCPYLVKSFKNLKFSKDVETWVARSSIGGWSFSPDCRTIFLHFSGENEETRIAALAYVDILNDSLNESQKKYLENCPVRFWDENQLKRGVLHFPINFALVEFDRGECKCLGGLTKLYSETAKEYLTSLSRILSQVDLSGIGDFREKKVTRLSKVFIDVEVTLASGWHPENYDSFDEVAVARITSKLLNKSMPITQAISIPKLKRIVLLGDPGSGKTTISQYLCLNCAATTLGRSESTQEVSDEILGVAFPVTIRYFVSRKSKNPELSLLDYIASQVGSYIGHRPPPGFVEFWLAKEKSITIFDGLDEVIRLEDRRRIHDIVTQFIRTFPDGQYLITSRIVGYGEAPLNRNEFLHLILLALENEQAQSFVIRWYSEREPDPNRREVAIRSLQKALEDEHVGELARNPLLLTIMALVHAGEADLPRQRAKLYDKCAQAFLVNRDKAKDLLSYNEDEIKVCHEFLGHWVHCKAEKSPEGSSEVTLEELKENLQKEIAERYPYSEQPPEKKVDEFVDAAKRRVGLIVEQEPGIFAFGHRSFEEYFSARYISQNHWGMDDLWSEIRDKIGKPHWTEVLKLLAGIYGFSTRKGLDDFVRKLLEEDSEAKDSARSTLVLAGEIAGDKVPLNDTLLRNITDKVLHVFENATLREKALWNSCKNVLEHLFDTPIEKYMIAKLRRPRDWRFYTRTALYDFVHSKQFGKTRLDRILATL